MQFAQNNFSHKKNVDSSASSLKLFKQSISWQQKKKIEQNRPSKPAYFDKNNNNNKQNKTNL